MTDPIENDRIDRLFEINSNPIELDYLQKEYGRVWNTTKLAVDFEVLGFMAPFVVVVRKIDNIKGSLEFQHNPRYYFNFVADKP